MRKIALLLVLAPFSWMSPQCLQAADEAAARAAAIAAQQDFEERYKRLLSDIEDLKDGLTAQQKRMNEIIKEVQRLDEDATHAHAKFATRDDLNSLVEKVREMDRKREEDQKLVLKEVEKLGKLRATPVAVEPPQESIKPAESGKGFEYRVKSGDNFGTIVKKFNDKIKAEGGKSQVTVDQLAKANPGVNPSKLKVGQKIFVPDPSQ